MHAGAGRDSDVAPTTVVIEPTYSMRNSILIPEGWPNICSWQP